MDLTSKKILLVAYHFDPFNGVGAKRMSYWAQSFFNDKVSGFDCTVVTSVPQPAKKDEVYYLEDKGDHWLESTLHGISWIKPLKDFLNSHSFHFDYVVISGGPFGHFLIMDFLKKKYNCKIILDIRDPMAHNPRFRSFFLKDFVKRIFETKMLHKADHIITVNPCCVDIMPKSVSREKISIVENGYDERIVDTITTTRFDDGKIHIVHAGKFYEDPTLILNAMISFNEAHPQKKYVFHHIGKPEKNLSSIGSEYVIQHGEKNYTDTISIMKKCHVGFVVTSTHLLEYNTKIFDYVGCELDIFLATDGRPEDVCVFKLTSRMNNKTHWIRNERESVQQLLKTYTPGISGVNQKQSFTRKAGYDQFKAILNSL